MFRFPLVYIRIPIRVCTTRYRTTPMPSDEPTCPICPLCLRPIPPAAKQSQHHLVPKLRGGRGGETILVHQICHNEVHAALSETELARTYNTPDALRAHPPLAKFFAWVAKKPPAFHSRSAGKGRRRR